MKRYALLIGLLWLGMLGANAVTKRALIIGIGTYPDGSGWTQINGDKDIPLVEDILLCNGFLRQDITELANAQATASAIRRELRHLIAQAQSGDIIYIHFSGHGQQVTDLDGDEADGLDEAWVPYDACFAYSKGQYEGQNHIIDDELNQYLCDLRRRVGAKGKIIVVADACHSGDSTRGDDSDEDGIIVRGTADAFIIPPTASTKHSGTQNTPQNQSTTSKSITSTQNSAPASTPVDWVLISACKPYQSNREYQGHGSLTYALFSQKTTLASTPCTQLEDSLINIIRNIIIYTQTPIIEAPLIYKNNTIF